MNVTNQNQSLGNSELHYFADDMYSIESYVMNVFRCAHVLQITSIIPLGQWFVCTDSATIF